MDDSTKKPEPKPEEKPSFGAMQLLGMAAVIGVGARNGRKLIPGNYAEKRCKCCGAEAGDPLPCAFCPKPIVEKPTGQSL